MSHAPSHLVIVGGGAAGLAAAIFAAQSAGPRLQVIVLDGAKTLGAKILVSGGGRCNVTHDRVTPDDFNAARPVVRNILAAFDTNATVAWFASLGVNLKREETGKLFPVADSAKVVLAALLRRCHELDVAILAAHRVKDIRPPHAADPHFQIDATVQTIRCDRVILATGGRSLPRSGSDGAGWAMARRLGHTVTPTYAALAPLVLDPSFFHAQLSGISREVELSTFAAEKRIDRRTGSLLWTHFGISGPVVMDASRHWIIPHESGVPARMQANLLPGETFETTEAWLIESATARPRATLVATLAARLPERVAATIIAHAGGTPTMPLGQLSRAARRQLVHALTALPLPVLNHRGWNYAEVTAGGIPLNEIDYRSMQSRVVPGLYLAGEILDCDGRIGGFNFQWAWATGHLAGKAAAAPG